MNFAELKNEVASRLEDTNFDNFTEAEIKRWLNLGQMDIVTKTDCLKSSATTDVTEDQREYTLSDDCIKILRITYNDDRLGCTSFEELDLNDKDWMDDTGTPTNYLKYKNEIWLYPLPDASKTDGLKIFYVEMPDDMSADADIPFNGRKSLYPYHELIVLYALMRAYQKDEKPAEARDAGGEYMLRLRLLRGELTNPDEQIRFRGGRDY